MALGALAVEVAPQGPTECGPHKCVHGGARARRKRANGAQTPVELAGAAAREQHPPEEG